MTGKLVSADSIAAPFRDSVREVVRGLGRRILLRGVLASDRRASEVYAEYAAKGCADVGIEFSLERVAPLEVESAIARANRDAAVHGIMVYYPVFGGERDRFLQDVVAETKDVEGLHSHWSHKLYQDERTLEPGDTRKPILPCTPLAIVKALEALGCFAKDRPPLRGQTATVFNRSEVVGRPLAAMLAHDGARVFSFDVDGVLVCEGRAVRPSDATRAAALAASDIVVTGVPTRDFPLIRADEIKPDAVCVNFSTCKNMEDGVLERARAFLPRVGPITVAMLLRNVLRLHQNFHETGT